MVFAEYDGISMTRGDFAKLCAISFSAQRKLSVLKKKRLFLDPIDGPLSFFPF